MTPTKKAKHECESCNQIFDRVERLEDHIEKGCNRTKCTTCNKKFRTNHDLQCHQKNVDLKECEICKAKLCNDFEYKRHKQTNHYIIPGLCITCKRKFRDVLDLQRHQRNADPKVFDLCNTTFCYK